MSRQAVARIDWSKLLSIQLKPATLSSLTAFRKRFDESSRVLEQLREQNTAINFGHYRQVLQNKKVVDDAEKMLKEFKPVKVNLQKQLGTIDQLEKAAVQKARETADRVNSELSELQVTLTNISTARPVDQLTVEDVIQARPELPEVLDKRVQEGKWSVPGYYEKFGKNSFM